MIQRYFICRAEQNKANKDSRDHLCLIEWNKVLYVSWIRNSIFFLKDIWLKIKKQQLKGENVPLWGSVRLCFRLEFKDTIFYSDFLGKKAPEKHFRANNFKHFEKSSYLGHPNGHDIETSTIFHKIRLALKSKWIQLRKTGKGRKPNKSSSIDKEEKLWETGQLGTKKCH